jgi:hypothetical protein
MKTSLILSLTLLLLIPLVAFSQEQTMQMTPEQQKMMQEWAKYANPSDVHQKLTAIAGTYSVAGKMRMDAASEYTNTSATCVKETALGGRWLHEHCEGPGMMGMPPFEGMGLLGYNNYTKKYELYWFDNMSTQGFPMTGTANAAGNVITLHGSYEDPMTKKMRKARWVLTLTDANTQKLEFYDTDPSGKEYLGGELSYTRKS